MISLEEQLKMFDGVASAFILSLATAIMDDGFAEKVLSVARERLISGYEEYGDLMFTCDDDTARKNVIEELADAVNYMVSREVRFGKNAESMGTPSE
jgi:hypothetical protein